MSQENLFRDQNGYPVHAMRAGTIVNAAVATASANAALPTAGKVVEIASNTDCWIKFGTDGTVTVSSSTGMFFPKGVGVYAVDNTYTHLAFIRNADDGRISITRLY